VSQAKDDSISDGGKAHYCRAILKDDQECGVATSSMPIKGGSKECVLAMGISKHYGYLSHRPSISLSWDGTLSWQLRTYVLAADDEAAMRLLLGRTTGTLSSRGDQSTVEILSRVALVPHLTETPES
jgi:hypothetical protein